MTKAHSINLNSLFLTNMQYKEKYMKSQNKTRVIKLWQF